MQGILLHHSAPMQHVKFRVPTILTTPKIGGVPHHALERCIPRLAPLSSSPPCVAAGWHAGWVNRKKKGAKDRQDKEFWLTNLTMYQVYHVHGFAVLVCTISRCLLSPSASCTLLQVKAPKGKPHAPHVVQDVRNKKDGFLLPFRMGLSGPNPTRSVADKPHNPSSFQGHCRWPSKHTHSQPHRGFIGRRRFHWGTEAVICCVVNAFSTFR